MEQKEIARSRIDCGVVNCDAQNKAYQKFCLTTENLDEKNHRLWEREERKDG